MSGAYADSMPKDFYRQEELDLSPFSKRRWRSAVVATARIRAETSVRAVSPCLRTPLGHRVPERDSRLRWRNASPKRGCVWAGRFGSSGESSGI